MSYPYVFTLHKHNYIQHTLFIHINTNMHSKSERICKIQDIYVNNWTLRRLKSLFFFIFTFNSIEEDWLNNNCKMCYVIDIPIFKIYATNRFNYNAFRTTMIFCTYMRWAHERRLDKILAKRIEIYENLLICLNCTLYRLPACFIIQWIEKMKPSAKKEQRGREEDWNECLHLAFFRIKIKLNRQKRRN